MFLLQQASTTLQEIARESVPFFSNNWQGFIKVILVIVVPVVGLIGGFIWKIMQGPLQREDARIEDHVEKELARIELRINTAIDNGRRDLDGLGGRINTAIDSCTKNSTMIDEMRSRVDSHEFQIGGLRESVAEVKASLEALERITVDTKTEIIGNFMMAKNDMVGEVHKLAVLVARVDERVQILNPKPKNGG